MEQTNHFVLTRLPRTASSWSVEALRAGCGYVRPVHFGGRDFPHPTASDAMMESREGPGLADKLFYVQIRHPARWLRSVYWWSRKHQGKRTFEEATRIAMPSADHETFDDYVRSYLDRYPGTITETYERYTASVDFVGTTELCRVHLIEALRLAGDQVDQLAVIDHPPVNVTDTPAAGAPTPRWVEKELYESDAGAWDAWRMATDGKNEGCRLRAEAFGCGEWWAQSV